MLVRPGSNDNLARLICAGAFVGCTGLVQENLEGQPDRVLRGFESAERCSSLFIDNVERIGLCIDRRHELSTVRK